MKAMSSTKYFRYIISLLYYRRIQCDEAVCLLFNTQSQFKLLRKYQLHGQLHLYLLRGISECPHETLKKI